MRSFFCFPAVLALVVLAGGSRCLAGPPEAKPAAEANAFDAVARDIVDTMLTLGYTKDTADDLVHLVREWQCDTWRQAITQARTRSAGKHPVEVAKLEEEAIRALYVKLGREIVPCDPLDRKQMTRTFYLSEVVKAKQAQCLGYVQLYYILGKAIGLKVRVVDVLELASGPLPTEDAHVACLVDRSDGKVMIVDLALHYVSWPFVFQDEYAQVGNYWQLKQPNNPRALYRQIQVLDEKGIVADIYGNLAAAYAQADRPDKALAFCVKAAELNPKGCEAFCNCGNVHRALEMYQEALADYDKAIELNPKYAVAFSNRAIVRSTLGQTQQAIADYTKAIALNPKQADAYNNRGYTYVQSGQLPEAVADYTKAIELNPRHDKALFNRGTAYANLGKLDEARADLRKAAELNPGSIEEIKAVSDQFKLGL